MLGAQDSSSWVFSPGPKPEEAAPLSERLLALESCYGARPDWASVGKGPRKQALSLQPEVGTGLSHRGTDSQGPAAIRGGSKVVWSMADASLHQKLKSLDIFFSCCLGAARLPTIQLVQLHGSISFGPVGTPPLPENFNNPLFKAPYPKAFLLFRGTGRGWDTWLGLPGPALP